MLKKTIIFTDPFTDKPMEEEHYFHLSKADLVHMEMAEHGNSYVNKDGEKLTGMQAHIQKIIDSEDGRGIMEVLDDFLRRSYGKKDGDHFRKSQQIWDDFASTEAYSQFFYELCTNAEVASDFLNSVIPKDLDEIVAQALEKSETPSTETASPEEVPTSQEAADDEPEPRLITTEDMVSMNRAELAMGLQEGRYKLA